MRRDEDACVGSFIDSTQAKKGAEGNEGDENDNDDVRVSFRAR